MSVLHLKTDTIADFTGTVTVYDQAGVTQTVAATDLVRPSDWNSQHAIQMTLSGNTAGASTVSGSNIIFQGGPNFTISGNGDTIVFSAGPGGAGDGGNILAAGTRTAGTNSTVLFSNLNGISFGLDAIGGSVMTASHNALTTARASNDAIGLNTALTANGVSVTANSSGLSLNFPAFLTTAALSNHSHGNPTLNLTNLSGTTASNSAGFTLSLSANGAAAGVGIEAGTRTATTAGNIRFETGNGITFGLNGVGGSVMTASHNGLTTAALSDHSHGNPTLNLTNLTGTTASNSAGFTLSLSGNAAQTNQSAIKGFGVSNTGVTAGNTGISTGIDWVLAGSQSLTLSQSTNAGGPNTIWIQHPAWLTTARASTDGVGLNTALTAGPLAWTVNSGGISLNAGSAAGTTSGFAGTNISGSITHNTAGINIALSVAAPGGGGGTITMYATSNTTQSSTGTANVNSLIFAGAGAASVGISNGSIVISAPNAGAGNITISAGTTNGGLANVSFADSNNMSFGLNGSTITASFNAINLGVSTGGNTAGTTGTIEGAGGQYLFVGGSNISLSQSIAGANSGTVTINGPASSSIVGISGISISTNGSTISFMETPQLSLVCPDMALSVIGALGNGSFSIAYRDVNVPVSATRVDMPFFWSQASSAAANTVAIAMTVLCGIYTQNASTLNTVSSASTQTTYTLASNTAGVTAFSVARNLPISIPMNVNMSRGQYYMGFGISTTFSSIGTATTTAAQTISAIGVPQGSSAVPWVDNITRASATSVGMFSGHGIYSAAVSSVVPAISLSAINQSGSYFHRANIALVFRG